MSLFTSTLGFYLIVVIVAQNLHSHETTCIFPQILHCYLYFSTRSLSSKEPAHFSHLTLLSRLRILCIQGRAEPLLYIYHATLSMF